MNGRAEQVPGRMNEYKILPCKCILLAFQSPDHKEGNPEIPKRKKKSYQRKNMNQTGITFLMGDPEF